MLNLKETCLRCSDDILNLIYPRHCFVCGEAAPFREELCPKCRGRLPYIRGKRCRMCGKPIEETEVFCDDCKRGTHSYREGFGLFLYDDVMREAMVYLKYKKRQEYAHPMGELLYAGARDKLDAWRPHVLVPIPIHKKRRIERGYNQAELLARPISKRSGIPMRTDLLLRSHATRAMKQLNPTERRENLKAAFVCPRPLKPTLRVLLLDDIYTTGATIDAACDTLKAAGACEVFFLSVCIGSGFMIK